MIVSFRCIAPSGPHKGADLVDHGADVMSDSGIGETQNRVTVQSQLHIAPPTDQESGKKSYTIVITVGQDRHVVDVNQGPTGT